MATTRVATRPHPGESHEPRPRGGELPREYWSAYDPFVALMAASSYLLAGQPTELERLQLQSRVWGPAGRELLARLPGGSGRRVLDLGCGVMGWLRVLSEWVSAYVPPVKVSTGRYLASEPTMYRILRAEALLHHRERSKAPVRRPPTAHVATAPHQVWSWDITYLRSPVRGMFFYLYLVVDVWSRKIMAWEVYETESAELAAALIAGRCAALGLDPQGLVLHADNGGPMKGATMVATLERLGILPSFSRPRVSDDNPYSEALFRTLKYRPEYPDQPFADLAAARAWVEAFVRWYNTAHLHSGREAAILAGRRAVYDRARAARPERWSRGPRCWAPVERVDLNPERSTPSATTAAPAAVSAPKPERPAPSLGQGRTAGDPPCLAVAAINAPLREACCDNYLDIHRLRVLIQEKPAEGRLPHDHFPRLASVNE